MPLWIAEAIHSLPGAASTAGQPSHPRSEVERSGSDPIVAVGELRTAHSGRCTDADDHPDDRGSRRVPADRRNIPGSRFGNSSNSSPQVATAVVCSQCRGSASAGPRWDLAWHDAFAATSRESGQLSRHLPGHSCRMCRVRPRPLTIAA